MKITIVGPAHPYRGGIAKFNEVLAHNLILAGHDVDIVSFTLQYPSLLFPGKTQYSDVPAPNIEISRQINSINPLSWSKTAKNIAEKKPDLVIVRYWTPFLAPALGSIVRGLKKRDVKVVALTDNIVPHEEHFYDHALTNYFLKSVDKVVYMSRQVGEELSRFDFNGEHAFAPHPIYDTYGDTVTRAEACERLGLNPNKKIVMFFGFIRHYKGLDLLLDAWEKLDNKDDKQLLIAGEFYGDRDKYVEQIDKLRENSEVILHDKYIDEDVVAIYFSATDLLVQPYRTATQSGVTQVAYNYCVPMIVTNVGGLSEIIPHGKVGYVVDVECGEIAEAIDTFFVEDKANEFRRNIIKEKERFSWKAMIDALL